jgi:integrase
MRKVHPSLRGACDDGTMPKVDRAVGRVLGPYANSGKWRLVVFDARGRKAMLADSLAEAEQLKAGLLRLVKDQSLLTIGAALDEWLEEKRQAGVKPLSITTIDSRLRPFLPVDTTLGEMTPQRAAQRYLQETRREGKYGVLRACTHHKTLLFAKGFFTWAVERGYLRENPFAKVKPIGKASSGKPQLREDEARKLYELGLKQAAAGDFWALAVLVQLIMGLRSGEVLGLRVRDVDAGATVLHIDGTKSKNARRRLTIESEPLRRLLAARCVGRRPDELIFPNKRGERYTAAMLFKFLRQLCAKAGVPQVCPHSLRGLHSSLAVAHGASSRFVAEALGHGSDAITRKHYITRDALDTARVKRVAGALEGQPAPDLENVVTLLSALLPEQLAEILSAVADRRKTS